MKKGLISLAIVLSMVVSLFAPAIMVSAEEATGPNDPKAPVIIDFEGSDRITAYPDQTGALVDMPIEKVTSSYNEGEKAWEYIVNEDDVGTGALTTQIYTPEKVRGTEYKYFVVVAKVIKPESATAGYADFQKPGGAGAYKAVAGTTNAVTSDQYTKFVFEAPTVTPEGATEGQITMQNRIDLRILGTSGTKTVFEGVAVYIKSVAFFATEAEAAAFDLDTWRAEARNVSIEADENGEVGQTVTATITADGPAFASSKVTVKYDATKLSNPVVNGLGEEGEAVTSTAGIIEIFDVGDTKTENKYTITFDADDMGDAKIDLTYAAFSSIEKAATNDLFAATITTGSATVAIEGDILVDLPDGDWFDGVSSAVEGEPYTFTATKWANYDYPEVTYTMGGGESQVATPDSEGKYTIENVTGDLVISIASEPTAKKYDYTVNGDLSTVPGENSFGPAQNEGKVTYGKEIWFTVPEDQAADGLNPGWTYGEAIITIGGEPFTEFTKLSERTYNIAGAYITGEIVITIPKTELEAEQFAASVDGTGAGHAALDKEVVNNGESVSITVTKDALYDYTITATVGGQTVELVVTENDTVYTVVDVHGTVIFTVTKTLIATGSEDEYITVEGTQMWLVTIGSEPLTDGRVYTYDGHQMFWSDKYQAYCYLVISNSTPDVSEAKFDLVTGTATVIEYNKDVNKTGKVDVNDAQFVYNMYNFEYDAFTSDVTVEKFLRADLNDTKGVDVTDAQVIMSAIMPAVQG